MSDNMSDYISENAVFAPGFMSGKTVFITGATSGIGAAMALENRLSRKSQRDILSDARYLKLKRSKTKVPKHVREDVELRNEHRAQKLGHVLNLDAAPIKLGGGKMSQNNASAHVGALLR